MNTQTTEYKVDLIGIKEPTPIAVEKKDYEQIKSTLEKMEDDLGRPDSSPQRPDHQTSLSSTSPGGSEFGNVNLHSASTSLPTESAVMAHYSLAAVNEMVNKLQRIVDVLLSGTNSKGGLESLSHKEHERSRSMEPKEEKSWRASIRSIIHPGDAPLKDLPRHFVARANYEPTVSQLERDFVFEPSNKEEALEKKALEKLERTESKMIKKQNSLEAKIHSLLVQIETLQDELESEKQNVVLAEEAILMKRLELLKLKDKNDKERVEKERRTREKAETDKLAKRKATKDKLEELQAEIEHYGHPQAQGNSEQ